MALSYLSGDMHNVGKSKEQRKKKKEDRKKKKEQKKASGGGTVKKKIAKVALAPSREAFLTAVNLNFLKLGTKLARIWNKPGGKEDLRKMWEGKFSGDFGRLQKAISKGAKQQVSGDDIGVAVETLAATALPIILAMAPLIKKFRAEGDASEMAEFDQGVSDGQTEMANNPDFQKTVGTLPVNANSGIVRSEDGATEGSFFSAAGVCFKAPLMLSMLHIENPVLVALVTLINTLCFAGLLLLPIYIINPFGMGKFVAPYFEAPAKWWGKIQPYIDPTPWIKKLTFANIFRNGKEETRY